MSIHEGTDESTNHRTGERTVEQLRLRVQEIVDDNLEQYGSPGKAIDQCIYESQTESDLVHYILQSDPNLRKVYSGYFWARLVDADKEKAGPEGYKHRTKHKTKGTRSQEDALRRAWQPSNLEQINDLLPKTFDELLNMTYRQVQQAIEMMKSTISRANMLVGIFERMVRYAVPANLDTPMRDILPSSLTSELRVTFEGK